MLAPLDDALRPLVDAAVEQRTTIGVLGLIFAGYTGLTWIGNLREALTAQWQQRGDSGHSFLRARIGDVGVLLGLGLAILLSVALTAAGSASPPTCSPSSAWPTCGGRCCCPLCSAPSASSCSSWPPRCSCG